MKWISGRKLIGFLGGALAVLFLPGVSVGSFNDHKYRDSEIDMPVSLAVGTVRTPEFAVRHEAYFIMIEAERHLPVDDMRCIMGLKDGTLNYKDCNKEALLQADWTVWDDGHIASRGSSSGFGPAEFTNKYLFKFLGKFMGECGKKYVVEVKFTKDGTPLNVTNPHLIVILVRNH
jgi:hypothetical protein